MENDKIKTSRASQTREKTSHKKVWTPPSSLDAPPAPDGYRHRWIRAETLGYNDTKNVAASLREGYELVRSDEYPDSDYPTSNDGKYAGVIQVGGLLLARIPEEIALQIEAYYNKQTRDKDEAINNDLIDVIVSDHKPQDEESKRLTFAQAATGATGVETLLPLSLELFHNKSVKLNKLIATLTSNPANILGIDKDFYETKDIDKYQEFYKI